jgi:hypothetical protein
VPEEDEEAADGEVGPLGPSGSALELDLPAANCGMARPPPSVTSPPEEEKEEEDVAVVNVRISEKSRAPTLPRSFVPPSLSELGTPGVRIATVFLVALDSDLLGISSTFTLNLSH